MDDAVAFFLFSLLFVKTGKFGRNFGKYLANLKDDRESSDYEVFSYIDRETTETAITEAKEFLKEVGTYLKAIGITEDIPDKSS